jgi:hypothetical protein
VGPGDVVRRDTSVRQAGHGEQVHAACDVRPAASIVVPRRLSLLALTVRHPPLPAAPIPPAVTTKTREDKKRFLPRAKLFAISDKYLDGHAVARMLGMPIDDD